LSKHIPLDNHSLSIDLCGYNTSGNSVRTDLLAFDIALVCRLGVSNIELITNRFNSSVFRKKISTLHEIQVAQEIIIKRIPVLQTPTGPVISGIEKIRENNFLVDFRDKISSGNTDTGIYEIALNVEKEFSEYRNTLLLNKQKGSRLMSSIAKNALSFAIGSFIPGLGEINSLKDAIKDRKFSWTGFLAELEIR